MAQGPFDDFEKTPEEAPEKTDKPKFDQGDGWVSFTFNSEAGYERIGATVHGSPDFVAKTFALKDFNGKISQLMKRSIEIDGFFKKEARAARSQGKA